MLLVLTSACSNAGAERAAAHVSDGTATFEQALDAIVTQGAPGVVGLSRVGDDVVT